jgi:hypothetical protein
LLLLSKVSWIRKSDLHILTMGNVAYTADDRFSCDEVPVADTDYTDFVLKVRDTRIADSGVYECQINTEPKRSKAFQLEVVGE